MSPKRLPLVSDITGLYGSHVFENKFLRRSETRLFFGVRWKVIF